MHHTGVNPTEKQPMIQDRGGTENWTALMSLGIPKLVRFHKIRPPTAFDGINIP
jgi:hypothetical protein